MTPGMFITGLDAAGMATDENSAVSFSVLSDEPDAPTLASGFKTFAAAEAWINFDNGIVVSAKRGDTVVWTDRISLSDDMIVDRVRTALDYGDTVEITRGRCST